KQAEGKNVSIDSKIAPYLPSRWTQGPHVAEMTFKDLLTHWSGLRSVAPDEDSFSNLRRTIANGSTNANWQKREYQNCNFSLFRILIPNLLYGRHTLEANDTEGLEEDLRQLSAQLRRAAPAEKPALAAQIKALNAKLAHGEKLEHHTARLSVKFVK